jgi:hypothetical protein
MRKSCALALWLSFFSLLPAAQGDVTPLPLPQQPVERQYWWQLWRPAPKPAVQRMTAPPQLPSCPFVLELDDQADQLKLVVPRNLLKDLKVAEGPIAEPAGGLADSHNTLFAGMFLTMALASGGLWMVRRGVPGFRVLVIGGALLLVLGGTLAWADIPPFGGPRRNSLEMWRQQRLAELQNLPQITVEVVEQGDRIKLVVSRDKLAKLAEPTPARP